MANKEGTRIEWIDTARGIAMLSILFFHTEVYYTGNSDMSYRLYSANAVIVFFFISGFLFYRNEDLRISKKIKSIMRGLAMPYFIFMGIIALPKAIINNRDTSLHDIAISLLTGQE